jgi:hypothetical protein
MARLLIFNTVYSLTAGNQGDGFEYNSCFSMFTISIVLTKLGYENLQQVLSAVFR